MVELIPLGRFDRSLERIEPLGDALALAVLTVATLFSAVAFVVKGALDQLPDLFRSWQRVTRAWREVEAAAEDEERPTDA
jgi:hypothetical protein